jgi:retinol dehydrogenase-12
MNGKTVVITGGTSGIGFEAAKVLAAMGARVAVVGRDAEYAARQVSRLPGEHGAYTADLLSMAGVRKLAHELLVCEPRIDVLVNNAGALFNRREVTVDGLERTFALNHMAYFLLTKLLLERLKPGARIVSTSSDAHKVGRLDFDDLQSKKDYRGFRVYGTSKLCNILFTRELARRLEGTGITAGCLHPGFVDTRFADNNAGLFGMGFKIIKKIAAISPEKGARTIVHLASAPDVAGKGGTYWYKCRPVTPSAAAQNDADARRLWDISEELVRI